MVANQKLITALIAFQSQISIIPKTKRNSRFNTYYADIESVVETIRKPLVDNGLAVVQSFAWDAENRFHIMTTTLMHNSGESISSTMSLPPTVDSQQIGSAITYYRRYAIMSLLCLVANDEDDDGNASSKEKDKEEPAVKPTANNTTKNNAPPKEQRTVKEVNFFKALLNDVPEYKKIIMDWLAKNNMEIVDLPKQKFQEIVDEAKLRIEKAQSKPVVTAPSKPVEQPSTVVEPNFDPTDMF